MVRNVGLWLITVHIAVSFDTCHSIPTVIRCSGFLYTVTNTLLLFLISKQLFGVMYHFFRLQTVSTFDKLIRYHEIQGATTTSSNDHQLSMRLPSPPLNKWKSCCSYAELYWCVEYVSSPNRYQSSVTPFPHRLISDLSENKQVARAGRFLVVGVAKKGASFWMGTPMVSQKKGKGNDYECSDAVIECIVHIVTSINDQLILD